MALQNSSDTAVLQRDTGTRLEPERRAGSGRLDALAQGLSHAASPPALAGAAALAVAVADGRPVAFVAAAAFGVMGVLIPVVTLVQQWRRGEVSDLELTRRNQRLWPLVLTTTCVGASGIGLQLAGAPHAVAGLVSILGVQSLLLLSVTTSWKISVHCTAAASTGSLLALLTGHPEAALLLVVPMVWARLHLRRHTPLQCLAGSALGAALMLILWPMLGA